MVSDPLKHAPCTHMALHTFAQSLSLCTKGLMRVTTNLVPSACLLSGFPCECWASVCTCMCVCVCFSACSPVFCLFL
jgi:hypothetical protein